MSAPPANGYACRAAMPGDMDAVAAVLHEVFGQRIPPTQIRHKFGGPANAFLGSALLTEGAQIVGFLGQIPLRACCGGAKMLAVHSADMAILPAHRRLDTFLQLIASSGGLLRDAGVAFAFGFANADATVAETTLLGVQPIAPAPLLVRVLDPQRVARGGRCRRARATLAALGGWLAEQGAQAGTARTASAERVVHLTHFDARFDRLWLERRHDHPVAIVRDAAYLTWRYHNQENRQYHCLGLETETADELAGYAVMTCQSRPEGLRGRILDLIPARNRLATDRLLRAAMDWFRAQGVGVVDAWAFPHTRARQALLRQGFWPRRTGVGRFCVSLPQPNAAIAGQVLQARNWLLSVGDSDTA